MSNGQGHRILSSQSKLRSMAVWGEKIRGTIFSGVYPTSNVSPISGTPPFIERRQGERARWYHVVIFPVFAWCRLGLSHAQAADTFRFCVCVILFFSYLYFSLFFGYWFFFFCPCFFLFVYLSLVSLCVSVLSVLLSFPFLIHMWIWLNRGPLENGYDDTFRDYPMDSMAF